MTINEKQVAGASYILTFYQNVQQINGIYAQYYNVILELETRYKKAPEKVSIEERNLLIQLSQNLRQTAQLCYIQYVSIAGNIKNEVDTKIQASYDKLLKSFIFSRSDIEVFVLELNKFLVGDIIKKLLESSESLINSVINTENEFNTKGVP